jgi:hypothetical protein
MTSPRYHLAAAFGSPADERPDLLERTIRHVMHGVLGID